MKKTAFLMMLTAAILFIAGEAHALACSDPRPTPTPRYDMSPACPPVVVETPAPPESTPPTRAWCNAEKRSCKAAGTVKKRATSAEKSKKSKFTKQEAKKRRIQSSYDDCMRTVTRKINKLKTSAMPSAITCGPSLRDLVNRNISVDFFSCRSNAEVIEDFLLEERNRILGTVVDNVSAWIRTCALDAGVRSACTALEEAALAIFNGDDLDGLINISSQCRRAADNCIDEHRSVIQARRRACEKMDRYQRKANQLRDSALRCKDKKASSTDKHHEKLATYHFNWGEAYCDKRNATNAEPIICKQYNKHCK